jgi:cyclophilin family peptidyl-prolyl cis-trans isomerase/HEAT repeat protein
MRRLLICVVAYGVLSGCVRAVPLPEGIDAETMTSLGDWEERRSLGEGQLAAWAHGEKGSAVRARALRALARIQDPATVDVIIAGLTAAEPVVRDEAAFAAGELGLSWEPLTDEVKARLTEALLQAEAVEADAGVRRTLLESFSKVATPGAVERLTERLTDGREGVAGRAALALGVAGRRGASLAEVSLEPVAALLAAERPVETRYGAAYLLAYVRRPAVLTLLRRCLTDTDAEVRAICAKGFAEVGGPEDSIVLGRLLGDPVPRVAAETARSLAKIAGGCSDPCTVLDALLSLKEQAARVTAGDSASGHALLAVAQQGLPAFGRPVLEELRRSLQAGTPVSEVAADDVAWLDCRLAAAMDRQTGTPAEVLRCGSGRVPEARRLALGLREAAQTQGQGSLKEAVAALNHPDARVRMAALEAVSARPTPEALQAVRALIGSEDLVVAGAAAVTVGKMKATEALPEVRALAARVPQEPGDLAAPVAEALVELAGKEAEPVLRSWLDHPHANLRRVAAEALTGLTGQPVRPARVELPPGMFRSPPAPADAKLTFRTRKGDFTVALDAGQASLTSGNLYELARKGYFKNIMFHRVVPDFVAQGGDPRGDGEGGPGYSIRCEMTRRPYLRGTIGMALSGKDTGGSQFFFTHTPQPHLDGRYTAFGEVTQGMEVVDALIEGDVILEVIAEP